MSSKKYDFSGKVVLITGSSSGIGLACALQFAKCKANVIITGYEETEVQMAAEQIRSITNEMPLHIHGDLSSSQFAEQLVSASIDRYGRLDVLVNNAGWVCSGDSFTNPDFMKIYDRIFDLNVRAVFKMIHLCVPFLERTKGSIINTSSVAGLAPIGKALYSASKAAVNMLSSCAAMDLGEKGIRVNAVNPGPIRTNIGRYCGDDELMLRPSCPETSMTIMKRNGNADEVANMILFLASDEASYITGGHYVVDGGFLCH
ncbi:hypothetical protein RDWZM_008344 [Blomia tropicalis]|uniref:Uncharacterized protein n=1 Tax=Blomia tropicalis TaxID=40697 RepID=A0A9Q0M459_BLOTA|nr:hypothetical protein RDWZM_008344 [Blomia tropicalis]